METIIVSKAKDLAHIKAKLVKAVRKDGMWIVTAHRGIK